MPGLSPIAWIGVFLAGFSISVALFGPYLAPYRPDEIFGIAFAPPSSEHLLGLDIVGRDALSRVLWGGRTAIFVALIGNVIGFVIGAVIGLVAAYRRGWLDELIGRATDLALAFPALILSLLLLAAFGTSLTVVVIAIAVTTVPGVLRITRATSMEIVDLPYIEAARARGERASFVMVVEMLPNIRGPLIVHFGVHLTSAILLVAALSFVGLGLQPPAADWGLMIGENRVGLTVQPWPVVVAVCLIASLTIGINLAIDGYRRQAGPRSTAQTGASSQLGNRA
ncbi:MAG: ABC transporter permease [Gaiellales bacterium]